jgi:hypothetical protein
MNNKCGQLFARRGGSRPGIEQKISVIIVNDGEVIEGISLSCGGSLSIGNVAHITSSTRNASLNGNSRLHSSNNHRYVK